MFSEKDMQNIIHDHPEFFFGEDASLYQREFWICTDSRIDFVLLDNKNKRHLLVEVQMGKLNAEHSDKLWKRYIPNYKIMRPDVEVKGVLVANSASNEIIKINEKRGIEVKCYRPEEILEVDKQYVMKDHRPNKKSLIGSFGGFTKKDFDNILEAEKRVDPEIRLKPMGKLYQIRDFILPEIEKKYPDTFIDTKVSDRIIRPRLDVPWMAYYFGARAEGGTKIPHINFTLRDGSEIGQFHHTDCSVHINAELKDSFLAVFNGLTKMNQRDTALGELRNKGYQVRYYSKVPLHLPNVNDNFWMHRSTWDINDSFSPIEIINWFQRFSLQNVTHFEEEISRIDSIYQPSKYPSLTKHPKWLLENEKKKAKRDKCPSAAGRSAIRIGRWWKIPYVIERGSNFKEDVLKTIFELDDLMKQFGGG